MRDDPQTEDLGHVTREWTVYGYVLGEFYHRSRDALVFACSQPGAGELVHPYFGVRNSVCTECRVSESTDEGGIARFVMRFVDGGGNRYPTAVVDTSDLVLELAGVARPALISNFIRDITL